MLALRWVNWYFLHLCGTATTLSSGVASPSVVDVILSADVQEDHIASMRQSFYVDMP